MPIANPSPPPRATGQRGPPPSTLLLLLLSRSCGRPPPGSIKKLARRGGLSRSCAASATKAAKWGSKLASKIGSARHTLSGAHASGLVERLRVVSEDGPRAAAAHSPLLSRRPLLARRPLLQRRLPRRPSPGLLRAGRGGG